MSHPHYISIFHIHHMNYPDSSFTKLKYSVVLTLIIQRNQSHLDPHIDLVSTWLYPIIFCDCIKSIDSSSPKHNELLASHYSDLRFERYLYLYASWTALDRGILYRWVTYSVMMYSYISPVCYISVSILLG